MPRTEQGRSLRAVVFLDTVGSTQVASELGDERWQVLLRRELAVLRHLLKESGGREVDAAGDGLFALFREPAQAVRFAAEAALTVRELGLEIRAGVHFGECEFAEGHPGGIVVHTGARTMSTGGPGDVIVTQTVRDLVSGGHLRFASHGDHELKGVPGTWPLFKLMGIDGDDLSPPLAEDEAGARRREASSRSPVVRRRTFIAAVLGALIASSIGTYLLTRGDEDPVPKPPGINRLIRFDPATGAVTMLPYALSAPFGGSSGLAVGEGGVWATDVVLSHMDPSDGKLEGTVQDINPTVFQGSTGAITTGLDDVWVASASGLFRIDPADDEVLDLRPFTDAGQAVATSVAVGRDAVWVSKIDGTLFQISPTPGLPIEGTISLGGGLPSDIVIADEGVWVADEFGDLIRVDERTEETKTFQIGGTPKALAATEDRLWIVDWEGFVVEFDLRARRVLRAIPIGGRPVDIAVGAGAVWIADQRGEQLVRIDETSHEPVAFPLPGPPAAIAVDEDQGLIWIRTAGGSQPQG